MIARLVTMTFKEGALNTFLEVFNQYKERIRASEGCTHLSLIQNTENLLEISTYSVWENEQFLNNYRDSKTFNEVWPKTKVLFAKKTVAKSHSILVDLE